MEASHKAYQAGELGQITRDICEKHEQGGHENIKNSDHQGCILALGEVSECLSVYCITGVSEIIN